MNTSEKKYAISRIDGIVCDKQQEIDRKTETEAVRLTYEDKMGLVRQGAVKLRKNITYYGQPTFNDMFDFAKHETPRKVNSAERAKLTASLLAKAHTVRDEVMLGDSKEALKLIAEFEKA